MPTDFSQLAPIDPNLLFERYVVHSYHYYELDAPVITDGEYDFLCQRLRHEWPNVTHPDKHLTDESALEAGTGYQMTHKWPQWAIDKAHA